VRPHAPGARRPRSRRRKPAFSARDGEAGKAERAAGWTRNKTEPLARSETPRLPIEPGAPARTFPPTTPPLPPHSHPLQPLSPVPSHPPLSQASQALKQQLESELLIIIMIIIIMIIIIIIIIIMITIIIIIIYNIII
jgi:hypothetical protein